MKISNQFDRIDDELYLKNVRLDGYNVRGGLIMGSDRAVIFDTLSRPEDMLGYKELIEDRKLMIIYSHADWDHIWGTAGVETQPKLIISHKNSLKRFSTDVPEVLKDFQKRQPELYGSVKLIAPNITIESELVIDLGGITVQLSPLLGHTQDSIVAYIPEKGILLAGDAVETPFPCLGERSPVANWIEKLEGWRENSDLKTIIPAHGDISGPEILTQNINYLKAILNGEDADLPENMSEFYKEAHRDNVKFARKQGK
ncbi:MBL fold metallo-hydrolase [Maridesulfovibrio frigidus]|uniref:MBL fold metallo-hydrolase n=1 Tax=Maridesulfovibrio frigidus TaxID=340956 RepID=UPI0006896FED|nr:MBL fold metallo-hydrolase [Maridesulfovibrio frigidus]